MSVVTDSEAPARPATRTKESWLPVAIWTVVAVLALTLVWAVPRASRERGAAARTTALSASVAARRSSVSAAAASLAATETDISAADGHAAALRDDVHGNASAIARLTAEVRKLQSRKSALEAPPAPTPVVPILPPIHPPYCVPVPGPGGSTGVKCND